MSSDGVADPVMGDPSAADGSSSTSSLSVGPPPPPQPELVVRGEEVAIVVVVLMLWAAAIALFINRWGKIRLMEPYQPYFEPEPPPAAASETAAPSGAHRASVFDPRPSLTILPPSLSPLNLGE